MSYNNYKFKKKIWIFVFLIFILESRMVLLEKNNFTMRRIKNILEISPENFIVEIDYLRGMLGIEPNGSNYQRIIQILRTSTNPVDFVEVLSKTSGKSIDEVLRAIEFIEFFRPLSANYRLRKAPSVNPMEFQNKHIDIEISSNNYKTSGRQEDVSGGVLSDYLRTMREYVKNVPFIFRDNMERFVGRFLGILLESIDRPDLLEIIGRIKGFLQGVDLQKIKYVITSGIGANEMYSHQLAQVLNAYFETKKIEVKWIVVNNPAHLEIIPREAQNENTLIFEMSRSGKTKETVDFFNATRDRFKKRIVAANPSGDGTSLYIKAQRLGAEPDAKVLIIDDTRGDIGGRQMNRKTLMVYTPLFLALASGLKDITQAEKFLKDYTGELYRANLELDYQRGLTSEAVKLAEFLLRHRESGRNKFSIIYDPALKGAAKEIFQLINEGANKNIAGGTNDNILDSYSFIEDRERYEKVFNQASHSQLALFLLDKNSPHYNEALKFIESLRGEGIPVIVISSNLNGDLADSLKVLARTSALLQDMAVYFTYITNQDANSNPAVKLVREITGAMFEIIKDKKAKGEADIRITFNEVINKVMEKQANEREKAKRELDRIGLQRQTYNANFDILKDALKSLAKELGLSEEKTTAIFIRAISGEVLKNDIGEASGKGTQWVEEAFSRLKIKNLFTSPSGTDVSISSLSKQIILPNVPSEFRVSLAVEEGREISFSSTDLVQNLADYLFMMYQERKKYLQYITLTFMEIDAQNPEIKNLSKSLIDKFSSLNITSPLLGLPGVAHTGIEAVMSHPENIFNIAIIYTNTYGEKKLPDGTILGDKPIETVKIKKADSSEVTINVTIDDATYVYGISNAIRMALGGTPSIIFEVKNSSELRRIRETIEKALAIFRGKIKK